MSIKNKTNKIEELIGKPRADIDYYQDECRQYTVLIEVDVRGFRKTDDETDIYHRALEAIRRKESGLIMNIVSSTKIKNVVLDSETNMPFSKREWQRRKLAELGLNEHGEPLRAWEKTMPENQTKLEIK